MTERLYYTDSYLTIFRGRIVERGDGGRRIYLDRTAFYPASGGQPFDRGLLGGRNVVDVIDEGDRVAHVVDAPVDIDDVEGRIDWARRFDHMQQHSGQHLLSAVLADLFGIPTLSFHLGEASSTIDIGTPSLDAARVLAAERRVNEVVFENRSLSVAFQQASDAADLRKPSEREGELRIVSIDGLDRSACGGTHVRSTGEIGPVLLRKLDKVRGNVRIEFLCGIRAVRRARADYDALSAISRSFSSPLDETPALVAAQIERLHDSERALRKAASELAGLRGKELYGSTQPDGSGVRRVVQTIPKGAVDDELRALAQGFTSRPGGIFVAVIEDPPVLLLAASKGDGLHAGETLKKILAETGGRGGGNEQMAQASFPSRDALDEAVAALTR